MPGMTPASYNMDQSWYRLSVFQWELYVMYQGKKMQKWLRWITGKDNYSKDQVNTCSVCATDNACSAGQGTQVLPPSGGPGGQWERQGQGQGLCKEVHGTLWSRLQENSLTLTPQCLVTCPWEGGGRVGDGFTPIILVTDIITSVIITAPTSGCHRHQCHHHHRLLLSSPVSI